MRLIIAGLGLVLLLSPSGPPTAQEPPDWWSFAVIADPHIDGNPDHETRLAACVDWVNGNAETGRIRLAFILGDIAWGGGDSANLRTAKGILDGLAVPYIPLIGDNDIGLDPNGEPAFAAVFEPQYLRLSAILENWKKGPVAVRHPELGRTCYFQNMSFDHEDVHFLVADWASRIGDPAALHDVPGGTWPWFADDLAGCRKPRKENIVILSHHPMWNYGALSRYGFAASDLHVLRALTRRYAAHIDANLGGHLHVNLSVDSRKTAGHRVLVTDATFDDVNCLRLVYVFAQRDRIRYLHRVCRVEG